MKKRTYRRFGLEYIIDLARQHIQFYRDKKSTNDEIINSATMLRGLSYPPDMGKENFVVLEGFERTKQHRTTDEVFSRTTLTKLVFTGILENKTNTEILELITPLLIIAYTTSERNQKTRAYQLQSYPLLQAAFLMGGETWKKVRDQYIMEYKQIV